jgi:hypothetical protein
VRWDVLYHHEIALFYRMKHGTTAFPALLLCVVQRLLVVDLLLQLTKIEAWFVTPSLPEAAGF